jgi:hypothetical protein
MKKLSSRFPRQRGVSLLGLLVAGALLAFVAVVGMRIVPTAIEYMAIKRAIGQIANSGESTPLGIRVAFDKMAAVDDIVSVASKDLKVDRDGAMVTISFQYEKRVPVYGPVSLVIDYRGTATGSVK